MGDATDLDQTIQNLTNDAMYQKQNNFQNLNCWLEILSTAKIISRPNTTISHPRMLKKIQRHVIITYLDRLCNKTVLKLKKNTEIN